MSNTSLLGSSEAQSAAATTASYSEGAAGGFQVTTDGGTQNV